MRGLLVASLLCAGAALADVSPPIPPVPPIPPLPPLPPEVHGAQIAIAGHGDDALVPLAFFVMVFAIFVTAQIARIKREGALHETVRLALERGADVDVSSVLPAPRNDRRRGILLVSLGIGLFAFLLAADGIDSAAIGLVPAFLGFGYFAVDKAGR
jgi:hypothetical protein